MSLWQDPIAYNYSDHKNLFLAGQLWGVGKVNEVSAIGALFNSKKSQSSAYGEF